MIWRIYQIGVTAFFLFANIYWEWEIGGLAAGVMGAMLAWISSQIIARILWNMGLGPRFGIEGAPLVQLLYRPPDEPLERRKK